ncbi:D-glucuronyl C5-epimerase family protein [Streptomyces longwoodensis]|uniref:D-glucuronyl C5-epimerase family protein n=1 Tax=Streptomyces longwoodensis TaxID=68231 RepID=UPI0022598DD1|nr:D-glucuronyl C5-epimerase family protein [Streptomyces longwoodensis]MCX4993868.1 D-glucuronyl C5-epimerase family protein [Streptomyces longwoodensis]
MTLPIFNRAGYQPLTDLPEPMRPWRDRPTRWENLSPTTGTYHLNSAGVYMYYPATGGPYDHPVGQIQFGLGCIASHRTETDPARKALFLARAKAQADRLIATHDEARGAWWFPYPFAFTHAVHSGVSYQPPWYSGMAQGEAISLFCQLAQLDAVTDDERARYMAAADGAFASLQVTDDGYPWAVNINRSGYVWLQEYPGSQPGAGDYTYNGMIYAMFGLWDYYAATGSAEAATLYDGCATTIVRYFSLLRNPRWFSFYCQTHRIPAPTYHQHHIELFRQLHWQTGCADFADATDRLVDDVPAPRVSGSVQFAAGTYTLYRFDTAADGAWVSAKADAELERKTVTFSRATQAPASMRRRIQDRGIYYRISAGAYEGWWVGEVWSSVYLLGTYLPTVYQPSRTITLPGDSAQVTAYKVGADGSVLDTQTVAAAASSSVPADRRAIVNGRPMYLLEAGELSGYWVPASSVTADTSGPSTS